MPDGGGVVQGEVEEEALGDAAHLKVAVVGEDLPADAIPIFVSFP
jgi:hypothetical protein